MIRLFVANTDNDWFDYLSSLPNLREANLWQPAGKAFRAVQPGELVVFRLKRPRNRIGGFGVLSGSSVLPLHVAWDSFGRGNGAASYAALRDAVARSRPGGTVGPTTPIGCRLLSDPVFLPPDLWIDLPPTWSPRWREKVLATNTPDGLHLWRQLVEMTLRMPDGGNGLHETTVRYAAAGPMLPPPDPQALRLAGAEAARRRGTAAHTHRAGRSPLPGGSAG
jgi:putative restriction endonuclease